MTLHVGFVTENVSLFIFLSPIKQGTKEHCQSYATELGFDDSGNAKVV